MTLTTQYRFQYVTYLLQKLAELDLDIYTDIPSGSRCSLLTNSLAFVSPSLPVSVWMKDMASCSDMPSFRWYSITKSFGFSTSCPSWVVTRTHPFPQSSLPGWGNNFDAEVERIVTACMGIVLDLNLPQPSKHTIIFWLTWMSVLSWYNSKS